MASKWLEKQAKKSQKAVNKMYGSDAYGGTKYTKQANAAREKAERITERTSGTTPKKSTSSGVETLLAARDALQKGPSGRGGRVNAMTAAAQRLPSKGTQFGTDSDAAMTFGIYDPSVEQRGRVGNTLGASGKNWLAGQADTLAYLLGQDQKKVDKSRAEARDYMIEHGYAKPSDFGESKTDKWLAEQGKKVSAASAKLRDEAAEHEAAAKEGLGGVGRTLVDAGIAGGQMLMDAGVGALTGTGMLSMGTRTFGQGTREALENGATRGQAALYGAGSAAVEVATEKLFDAAKIFGGGSADELMESLIGKLAKSDAGRTALRTLGNMTGEAAEELISGTVNPLLRLAYDRDATQDYKSREFWADTAHDALVGAVLGGVGSGASILTGQNAAANAQLREAGAQEQAAGSAPNSGSSMALDTYSEQEANNLMSGAKNRIVGFGTSIREFVQNAFGTKGNNERLYLGKIPNKTADMVLNNTGLEVHGFSSIMIGSDAWHAMKDHSDPVKEQQRGQIPLTEEDFELLPQILADPDNVRLSGEADSYGRKAIIFEKEIGNKYVTVQGYSKGKQGLMFDTMWVNKKKPPVVTNAGVNANQGQTPAASAGTASNNSLSQNKPNVKTGAETLVEAANRVNGTQNAPAQPANPNDVHIDRRTPAQLSNPRVNAFQYDHPEMRPFYAEAARQIQEDAANSLDTQMPGRKGGTNAGYTPGLLALLRATQLSRPKLIDALQNIIDDSGKENNAAAKKAEAGLNKLLRDNPEYEQAKAAIDGGYDPDSWEYARDVDGFGWLMDVENMTEEEAKAEWQRQKAMNAELSEAGANNAQAETANGLPPGQGAMSPAYPYRAAQNQTNSTNPIYTDEERATIEGLRPEDRTHQVRTNADVDYHADERLEYDYDGEKADLFRDDKEWDVDDVAVALRILDAEAAKAREAGSWDEVRRLQKIYDAKASNWGQVGHEMGRHAHSPASIVAEAEKIIGDEPKGKQTMDDVLNEVYDYATELQDLRDSGGGNIIDLIKRLNARRRTGGFFTPERTGNTLSKALNNVLEQEGGFDYLLNIAESQIYGVAQDSAKTSTIEAVKSVRYMAMLSKLSTVMRNLVGNNVFDPVESLSNNIAILPDAFMSHFTGQRTTGFDASWLSKAKRGGSAEGMQRAYIAAALDADPDGASNRYEKGTGRTFKMASRNPLVRFLSTIEKIQAYELNVTDEFQKGGIQAEQQRIIDRLERKGKLEHGALDGWAEETAKQRTFQNDGAVSALMQGARNLMNVDGRFVIRDSRGGSFGLGDAVVPFARVPGNVVGQFLNYTPAGFVRGMGEMTKALLDAKHGKMTAQQQAKVARDIGRGLNGSALLAGLAAVAAKGLLSVSGGEDDKDETKLKQSEGVSGTQWNLSATMRWLQGGNAAWKDGDELMSIGFLEPINGIMALASLLADTGKDDGSFAGRIANATAEAAMQSIADLPAMSSLTNIINNYKYSSAEGVGGKMVEVGAGLVGDTVSSFVPNMLAGIAQGMDGKSRQTYSSDRSGLSGVAQDTLDSVKSKIPGLRETLPAALDSFGRERETTATPLQNWLNSNILPGSINRYDTNRVNQEIRNVAAHADAVYPSRSAETKFQKDNHEYKLTAKQQRAYQKQYGATFQQGVNALLQSAGYQEMSWSEKSEALNAVKSYAKQIARQKAVPSYELDSTAQKAFDAEEEAELSPAEYLVAVAQVKRYNEDGEGRIKQDEIEPALDEMDLEDWQKAALWRMIGGWTSDKNNPYT